MKTILLILSVLFYYNISYGQFTFNSSFNPVPGNVYKQRYVDTTNLNPGSPGPNQNWDFSSRGYLNDSLNTIYVSPSSTPYGSLYPTATVSSYDQNALQYTYYFTSNSTYNIIGFASDYGNYMFTNPEVIGQYPFVYNQKLVAGYTGVGNFSPSAIHISGTLTTTCDGYGTINLPSGTSAVMRLKTTYLQYDSLYYNGIYYSTTVHYDTAWRWLKNNYKFPIFSISHSWTNYGYSKKASIVINSSTIGISQISSETPDGFALSQNFPNPFNPVTKIQYDVKENSFVSLKVFDILGREISTLVNQKQSPGKYEVSFDGNNFSSGVYFYRLQAGNFSDTKKLILQK